MALYGIANTQLSDTFNTWRVASNNIRAQAASATGNNSFTGTTNSFTGDVSITGTANLNGAVNLGNAVTDLTTIAGRATIGTNLAVAGNTAVTGTLTVAGRATIGTNLSVSGNTAIAGNGTVGGSLVVDGAVTLGNATTDLTTISGKATIGTNLTVAANTTVTGLLMVGQNAEWVRSQISNTTIYGLVTANTNNYAELAIHNRRDGTLASSDLIAIAPLGNDTGGYIDVGINSSTYNDPVWGLTTADDAYILVNARTGATGHGDLIIATGTNGACNRIILAAGGFVNATPHDVTITPTTGMIINYPTTSTSTTTGALVVSGGVGIQGNLNVQGNFGLVGNITIGGNGSVVTTSTLNVNNSLIFLATANPSDNLDIGEIGKYDATGTKYTGVVRDATDKVWKFFSGVTSTSNTIVDFTSATYDAVRMGALTSTSIATSGLITSGTIGKTGGVVLTLPTTDGTSGQALLTNGSGTLSFGSAGISTGKAIAMAMIFGG